MKTPVANKNRTGLMGPEHIRRLDGKADQTAVAAAVAGETSARTTAIAAAIETAVRRALYNTRWIAG